MRTYRQVAMFCLCYTTKDNWQDLLHEIQSAGGPSPSALLARANSNSQHHPPKNRHPKKNLAAYSL